ncbi:hypothetical protein C8R42DRAFT_643039 [Lentinula raphanica]|nr:hypothetical protein C8R42DRAFT_643039 [Lentinula raphanica]
MAEQIAKKRAPAHAIAPRPIPMKELFSLDVDDAIWDDCGLEGDDDSVDPPLWLSDDQVRHEVLMMEEWFSEEWKVVIAGISNTQALGAAHKSHPVGPGPDELREVEHEIQAELVDQICESEEVDEDSELDEDDLDIVTDMYSDMQDDIV